MTDKRFVFTKQTDIFCEEYKIMSATSHVLVGWLEHTEPDGWKLVSNAWLSADDIAEILDFMRGLQPSEPRVFTAELMCPKCKIGKLQRGATVTEGWIKVECDKCDYGFELAFALPKPEQIEESEQ